MPLSAALAIVTLLLFLAIIMFSKNVRRSYLLFSICALPFIDIPVTTANLGSLKVFDALSYLTFAILFKDFIAIGTRPKLYFSLYGTLVVLLLIGSLTSEFVVNSLLSLLSVFPVFIFAKLLINECEMNEDFKNEALLFIKAVGIFSFLFVLAQVIFGLNFTFYPNLNPNTSGPDGNRYPSFFHDPQKYAQYIAMLSFLYLPFNPKQVSLKHIIPFIASIYALLLTGGRSALLGLGGGLLILFLLLNARIKIIILALFIAGCIPLYFFSDVFITFDRAGDFESDYAFRSTIWKEAFEIFTENPLLGIGNGNYQKHVQYYSLDQYFIYDNEVLFFDQPENGYLKILVEFGVFGFVIFLLFFIMPITNAINSFLKGNKNLANFFFIASIVSCLIAFNSVYSLSDRRIMIILVSLVSFLIASESQTVKQNE